MPSSYQDEVVGCLLGLIIGAILIVGFIIVNAIVGSTPSTNQETKYNQNIKQSVDTFETQQNMYRIVKYPDKYNWVEVQEWSKYTQEWETKTIRSTEKQARQEIKRCIEIDSIFNVWVRKANERKR